GALEAGVHAAGDRVRDRAVHDLRASRGLRDRLGRKTARRELPPQGLVRPRLRRVHRRDHPGRRAARGTARQALPARRRAAPAPGAAGARPGRRGALMTATTGMSSDEAVALIEAAASPASLFGHLTGADAQREYRRLARLVHPDASPAHASSAGPSKRAAAAFAKLSALWQQREGTSGLATAGDIANLIRLPAQIGVPGGLLKLARDPADGDLIGREAAALRWLASEGDKEYLPYVPVLAGTRRYVDPATGITRRANVLDELTGFIGLDVVR